MKHVVINKRFFNGFTLIELVTVIMIVGILSVAVLPRFFDRNTFDSRGFYDQVISTLRYAQKVAIAQHRYVCVAITGGNTVKLTQGSGTGCGSPLVNPAGGATYEITAPTDVTVSNATFYFDALGKPSLKQSLTVSGYATAITVEEETGYVH
jgi:MSHA pilin protein MshC